MSKSREIKNSPKKLEGSVQAKRTATVILEVLSGLRSPTEASEELERSVANYYIVETRALQGMIDALEPRPRGRQVTPEDEIKKLEAEIARLNREVLRYQSLVRAAQRSMGVKPAEKARKKDSGGNKVMRKRRPSVRAKKVVKALQKQIACGVEAADPD